jgi:predicted GH43/DUF377 family glycosyl hydrolase
VAEKCVGDKNWIRIPVADLDNNEFKIKILSHRKSSLPINYDSDPRYLRIENKTYLSSLSHLRIASSTDGIHFQIDDQPFLYPQFEHESFGIEDPRITKIGGKYLITYSAVSENGIGAALAVTEDFKTVKKLGMIFPPDNKDVCIFPEKINNKFFALHRPMVSFIGKPSIWISESEDLLHWGNHSCIMKPFENKWENEKIGAGPPPIKTEEGWILLYHSCGVSSVYTMGLCLLDKNNPLKILKRTKKPVLIPKYNWEKEGVFPDVVFSNGWVKLPDRKIYIYYGAADKYVGLVKTDLSILYSMLK